jgi:hypothetical protein
MVYIVFIFVSLIRKGKKISKSETIGNKMILFPPSPYFESLSKVTEEKDMSVSVLSVYIARISKIELHGIL